ncbi:HIG1 domain family member 2A, mitochondrial-like [Hylaeus anthracinus]|uniref:HIG1 domain family member 2A, mitochondrial-like n=1 Tax=Hylaeus anthracinus TaxID=313031 RepID=UPI0023B8F02B|nr:HIG1 domain family member 2A, mitochondrial-like [Hylaeus anthracinus]XP_054010089.1 HIG1 domain family member 2A, mitochondrial-like [Hylaeus anthracinus]XP_054010090.1 HIG1 domain family member 2A, mitochondrial-like [Hylaeus anthracinus]
MEVPNNMEKNSDMMNELDWIRIRAELSDHIKVETFTEKMVRKTKENPVVPLGAMATVAALTVGVYNFYHGNTKMSQYMMRARVGAQAFTIFAMVAGFMLTVKE